MKYHQPYGVSDPNAPYVNGNPSTGTMGSIPPAESIEYPQREIVEMITDAGINPDDADLKQLAKAIQSCAINYVLDTGTVNQINVVMTPAPEYRDGLVLRVKIAINNTGPSIIDVNVQGNKKIRRKGDTDLFANDLAAGSIAEMTYNSTLDGGAGAFELSGVGTGGTGTAPPSGPSGVLTSNKDLYVNGAIGNDTNDGTANDATHALKTIQRAVDIAFGYVPSQYFITIHVAAGAYTGTCQTPNWGGPHLYVVGAGTTVTSLAAGNGYGFIVQGPGNYMDVTGIAASNTVAYQAGAALFVCGSGSYMHCHDTASGPAGNGVFQVQGAGFMQVGKHTYSGNIGGAAFYVNIQGYLFLDQSAVQTIANAITVGVAWAWVGDLGILVAPSPPMSFPNAGLVTGRKYNVALNGVIDANSLGVSYFPGTVAGVTSSGGQYNP